MGDRRGRKVIKKVERRGQKALKIQFTPFSPQIVRGKMVGDLIAKFQSHVFYLGINFQIYTQSHFTD